jgi:hypothetical protein
MPEPDLSIVDAANVHFSLDERCVLVCVCVCFCMCMCMCVSVCVWVVKWCLLFVHFSKCSFCPLTPHSRTKENHALPAPPTTILPFEEGGDRRSRSELGTRGLPEAARRLEALLQQRNSLGSESLVLSQASFA